MLAHETTFPFPGSKALLDGFLWTIFRHHADGTALLLREGVAASLTRTAPLADLTDPACRIARRSDADLAVRFALAVRDQDELSMGAAMDIARDIHDRRLCTATPTPNRLRDILVDLGWAARRTPAGLRYVRVATTLHNPGTGSDVGADTGESAVA